jgi:exopolysaccharide production protein ExoQ
LVVVVKKVLTLSKFENWCRNNSSSLVFLVLLVGSGLFSQLLTNEYSMDGGRRQIALSAKLLLASSYGFSMLLIMAFWREFKQKFTGTEGLWLVLSVWTLLSVVLGQFNVHALVRLFGFFGCTLIGVMLFVCTSNLRQVMMTLLWVATTLIVVNVYSLGLSGMIDMSAHNIKGVFYQKNLLGHFSFLTMFISGFIMFNKAGVIRWFSILIFSLACWLLILSSSMTSNLLIPIATLAVLASVIIGYYQRGWMIVGSAIVVLSLLLILNWSEIFSLLGKNTTFTGRTFIWDEYWTLIKERLFTGHGYGAYPEQITEWLKVGPHSGYVELIYYIGAIGAVIMTMILGFAYKNWWNIVRYKKMTFEASFLFSFLAVFLSLNITETYMLNRSGLFWPLFVYVTLQLAWLNKESQLEKGEV